jgi:TPP-dependent 2-oxoacid decarboxylase
VAEVEDALAAADAQPATLTFIEVVLDRYDTPPLLRALLAGE